jgi:hypothetical protein
LLSGFLGVRLISEAKGFKIFVEEVNVVP